MGNTTVKPKLTSYVSVFTLRLGPISTTGKLVSVTLSDKAAGKPTYNYIAPGGKAVNRVFQDTDGKVWKEAELSKGIVTDVSTVAVDSVAIAAAKESLLPQNVLNVTVHDAVEVDRGLFPSDHNAYVLYPDGDDPANAKWHDFIVGTLTDNKCEKTLVGMCNLRGNEGLFRVTTWRGRLVIQRQKFPTDLNDHEIAGKPSVTKAEVSKGISMLDKLAAPFNPESYRNTIAERQIKLIEAAQAGDTGASALTTAAVKPKKTKDTVDVLAALESLGF